MVVRKLNSTFEQPIIALYQYGCNNSRLLAHGVKDGNVEMTDDAARKLAVMLKSGTALVPIPNSCGRAVTTLALCERMAQYNDLVVLDAIVGNKREKTLYQMKAERKSLSGVDFGYAVKEGMVIPDNAVLVDNVYDTGTTYRAARKATGITREVVIGATPHTEVRIMCKMSGKALV